MSQAIHLRNHPFRFLLFLEWGLVAIALFSQIAPSHGHGHGSPALLGLVSTLMFGLMGVRLPAHPWAKIAYTALEFGLILLTPSMSFHRMRLFPLLYLVVIIRSCLMFSIQGRLIVSGLAYGLFAALLHLRLGQLDLPLRGQERIRGLLGTASLTIMVLFALVMLFVLLMVNALLAERHSREQLVLANQRLRDYALQVEDLAMTQERNRIARDIHDSLGHSLTALNIQLEGAMKLWQRDPPQAQQFLQQAKRLGSTSLQDVRQSVAAIRRDPLAQQSLEEAIAALLKTTQQTVGIHPTFQMQLDAPIPAPVQTVLYRIAQEALTNVWKHAQATAIALDLRSTSTNVTLQIRDNGQGFDPDYNQTGFGLQGMRERSLALDGTFVITSAPQQGCCITVQIPYGLPGQGTSSKA
jgi:signal transduction histidine kinase